MSAVTPASLPEGQQEAIDALRSIARASDGALSVDLDYELLDGELKVRVYLASTSLLSSGEGEALEDWEPIDIAIPERFPYDSPIATTGRDDFPELPHQAWGSKFCVRVEDSNWDPTAGMPGFMRAVIETYQHIALGTLQGHLQSWRPMVSYLGPGCAVIKADLAATDGTGPGIPFRWAVGVPVGEDRIDITEWLDVDDGGPAADPTSALAREAARINAELSEAFFIPAVITAKPVALEYFDSWLDLLVMLQKRDVDAALLLTHLARAATISQSLSEGPMRAVVLFRAAADTPPAATGWDARFAVAQLTQDDVRLLASIGTAGDEDSLIQMRDEFFKQPVRWTQVYDGRPESVLRRTASRPTEQLAGTEVLLLGCGGLGAPIAEHCVRAGAAHVHIVDPGTVSPGVLSRQPYEDADIGKPKADVLANRLRRIRPDSEVTASLANVVFAEGLNGTNLAQFDLIIDATANRAVAARIERCLRDDSEPWPSLVTVAISQQATHGVAAVTPRGAVGAGIDLLRQLGLRTCMSTALSDVYAAFFPSQAERLNFRPDASCSDITFIGSATDISALAAQLLDSALARLDLRTSANGTSPLPHRSLNVVRLDRDDGLKPARVVFDLPSDRVIPDHKQAYDVRIDGDAMETIREHARASANGRTPGAGHTGGLLLGQFDSACRIAWVSQATGLPPGSDADPLKIKLKVTEVRDFLDDRSRRSGGSLTLIGFWHTHPGGSAAPSDIDRATMQELVASPEWSSAPALLVVFGVPRDGSVGEPASPWDPEIHAETFSA
jgi:proteasome lid subunit RPN8/RPN11